MSNQQPPGYPPQFAPPPGAYAPAPQAAPPGYPPPQAAPPGYPPPQAAPPGYPPQGQGGPPRGFPAAGRGGRAFDADAIAGSSMTGTKLPYFLDGEYVVELDRTLVTQRKPTFIAECLIHVSNNSNRPQGFRASWCQSLNDPDVAYPSIKRFAGAGIGCNTEAEVANSGHNMPQLLNAMADPDVPLSTVYPANPLKGRFFRLIVTTVMTKKNQPFTRHDFYPYLGGG